MKILVSGVGGDIAQSITRVLRSYYPGSEVIGSDIHSEFILTDLLSKTFILPSTSSDQYLKSLVDLLQNESIDLFIPTSEPELRWLSDHTDDLDLLPCHCLMPSIKAMKIGFDKYLTNKHLQLNNLPYPWTTLASEANNAVIELPCILKSRFGAGSSTVSLIDNRSKLKIYSQLFPDYILQEFLPISHGEFTCGVYRCLDGTTRVITMRRRLSAGVTSYAEVVSMPYVDELCTKIALSLDLYGSINIQFRYVEGKGPMVFEINPRFSSTVGLRHKIGFTDLIWSIEEMYFCTPASPVRGTWPKVKVSRRYEEILSYE